MTSTARIGWVVGFLSMTFVFIWQGTHYEINAAEIFAYGIVFGLVKVAEKALERIYGGNKDASKTSDNHI